MNIKNLKVFGDFHHGDLFESLRILFEDRFGGKLFKPIGLNWAVKDYWLYGRAIPQTREEVEKQYLEFSAQDGMNSTNEYFIRYNPVHGTVHKMLTIEQFFKMPIDIILCSIANHEHSFTKLAFEHPNKPKVIRQVGNINEIVDYRIIKNVMLSAKLIPMIAKGVEDNNVNVVIYHPEFDLDIFNYSIPNKKKRIISLMNCLPVSVHGHLWEEYKRELPEFDWKMHGILGKDGNLDGVKNIAKAIKRSTFIFHPKFGGDGYGFSLHYSAACGRPLIVTGNDYRDKLGGLLLEDKITCIDLDAHSFKENIALIRYFAIPKNHKKMCKRMYERFREIVNFDKEFLEIKDFLIKLQ